MPFSTELPNPTTSYIIPLALESPKVFDHDMLKALGPTLSALGRPLPDGPD